MRETVCRYSSDGKVIITLVGDSKRCNKITSIEAEMILFHGAFMLIGPGLITAIGADHPADYG